MKELIVLTPTYNRSHTLFKLYESLIKQTFKNFTWLIIDDGSTDNTELQVESLVKENLIDIQYIKQENGGKARALNKGFNYIKHDCLFVIVDSDDHLLSEGLMKVKSTRDKYRNINKAGGYFFHYQEQSKGLITAKQKLEQELMLSPFEYFKVYGKNDGCLCYEKKVVLKYQYPEFEGEKYVGPTVLQMSMANEFNIVYSPSVVGVAEYQENGLTRSGRKLRMNNPNGMIVYNELKLKKEEKLIEKLKFAISIWAYYLQLDKSAKYLIRDSDNPFLLMFTYFPGLYLNLKWMRQ